MEAVLEAVRRTTFGRNNAGRLRRQGQIPAVVYGGTAAPESLAVDPKHLLKILHSESGLNTLISLKIDGSGDTRVLVKDFLLDPVRHQLLHADFYRLAMDKPLRVTVPVQLTGEARGVKQQGGHVDFVHREFVIECLPGDIPEHITIDLTNLLVNEGVRVRDIETGGKWKPVSESELLIVHVVPAKGAAADATAEGAAAAEPEVIKKGKTEKDKE